MKVLDPKFAKKTKKQKRILFIIRSWSNFTICVKCEICKEQFSPFCVILCEKLVHVSVISREIAEITLIGRKWEFVT